MTADVDEIPRIAPEENGGLPTAKGAKREIRPRTGVRGATVRRTIAETALSDGQRRGENKKRDERESKDDTEHANPADRRKRTPTRQRFRSRQGRTPEAEHRQPPGRWETHSTLRSLPTDKPRQEDDKPGRSD